MGRLGGTPLFLALFWLTYIVGLNVLLTHYSFLSSQMQYAFSHNSDAAGRRGSGNRRSRSGSGASGGGGGGGNNNARRSNSQRSRSNNNNDDEVQVVNADGQPMDEDEDYNYNYNDSDDDDDDSHDLGGTVSSSARTASSRNAQPPSLSTMFAQPTHLMHRAGGFMGAKNFAKDARRWLLVNIQSDDDFACHALNRDVWRDELVENLVREGFILWQAVSYTHQPTDIVCCAFRLFSFILIDNLFPLSSRIDSR